MKAIVVYESLWGNTAAIARAIAEGIGPEAQLEVLYTFAGMKGEQDDIGIRNNSI